jgi:peptidoglycan/LPS O-acetylase OafA/YrhL
LQEKALAPAGTRIPVLDRVRGLAIAWCRPRTSILWGLVIEVATLVTVLFAVASYHFYEQPFLRL